MAKKDEVNLEEMVLAARRGADKAVAGALDAQFAPWFGAFREQFHAWVKENPNKEASKFSYTLGLVVKIKPSRAGEFLITAQSGFSVRHKATSLPAIVQLELGLDAKEAKAAA